MIVQSIDERGDVGAGWRRVRPHLMPQFIEEMLTDGLAALKQEPVGSPRRKQIGDWVARLADATDSSVLKPGTYPLAGKAAIVLSAPTMTNIERAREQSAFSSYRNPVKRRIGQSRKSTPTSTAAAIAAAKQALTAPPRVVSARQRLDAAFAASKPRTTPATRATASAAVAAARQALRAP